MDKASAALVTGASGGIGGAIARQLGTDGLDIALAHGKHHDDAEQAAESLRGIGRRAVLLDGDLADARTPARLVESMAERLGPCDVLVVSSGVGDRRSWDELDVETWDYTVDVNLRASWLLTQAVLPGMIERGFGRILYVSSVAALNGGVIGAHYAASKAGLAGLMHHLAPRVAPHGVTINTVAPGPIAGTRMVPVDPSAPDTAPVPVPVGRMGTVEEVADLAAAIVRNAYLTDETIALEGGLVPR